MELDFKKQIVTFFQMNGLSIRREASIFLSSTLLSLEEEVREEWLKKIIENIQNQTDVQVVDKDNVVAAIAGSCRFDSDGDESLLSVISAYEIPHFYYDGERNKFMPSLKKRKPELYDEASARGTFYKNRYTILLKKTLRNPLFCNTPQDSNKIKLYSVDYLLSSSKNMTDIVILGMIAQLKENKYFLEDPTGIVEMDLSKTIYHDGLFVDTIFVLAEGSYYDGIFYVQAIGLPPREPSNVSRIYFGSVNSFGGPLDFNYRHSDKLLMLEQQKQDAMIVIISDIWLDKPKVLDKLSLLFGGYSSKSPPTFVLMGDFLSSQKDNQHYKLLQEGFRRLGDLISQFPDIANNSKFIIVPGPLDSPTANILPRPALPELFIEKLKSKVQDIELATSPCRIRYCTQEIVLIRENLVTKMCRNSIHFPESKDIHVHFAKTILCQANLISLSPNICPVYWGYDNALQLYPSPDLIVVGEVLKPFSTAYNNCQVINPGSFSKGEFTFSVYYPATRTIDDSQIPDDV